MAHRRKPATSAICLHFKQWISYQGTLGTQEQGQPLIEHYDLSLYQTLTFSAKYIYKHFGTLLWLIVPYSSLGDPSGTSWTQNEPCEAIRNTVVKKGPLRSLHGQNWSICLDKSLNDWIKSLVQGQSYLWFQKSIAKLSFNSTQLNVNFNSN